MTNKIKILVLMMLGLASTQTQAQSTATAGSEASMIIPIAITKLRDMNFGELGASAIAGTVKLYKIGTVSYRDVTGGVTESPLTPTYFMARFQVSGEPDHEYLVSLPASVTVTGSISGTMVMDEIETNRVGPYILPSAGNGDDFFVVGGTLHVGANQPSGVYTNASDLYVTVNYP